MAFETRMNEPWLVNLNIAWGNVTAVGVEPTASGEWIKIQTIEIAG